MGCSGLAQVTLPPGLTQLGHNAFDGCTGLTQITLPPGLTQIGTGAFTGCSGLDQVTLPASLTQIGPCAFMGCSGLAQITLPLGLTQLGYNAFEGCSGLTQITLPPGLTQIAASAFNRCTNIGMVLVTLDLNFTVHGIPRVLQTDAVLSVRAGGVAVRWAPRSFATLRGDVVEVQLDMAGQFRADFDVLTEVGLAVDLCAVVDVMAEVRAAAAAELGVLPEDIFVVDGKAIVYRPAITVGIVVLDGSGTPADAAAAPVLVQLATECGPTDDADTVVPTTVRYAARKIARTVFGILGSEAGAAAAEAGAGVRLHMGDESAAGLGEVFRELGSRDQDAVMAAAGIVDGAVLGARKRGWLRRRSSAMFPLFDFWQYSRPTCPSPECRKGLT